jgi:hypothetical protein
MLRSHLKVLPDQELRELIISVFDYDQTGILAENAYIRNLAVWIGQDNALGYLTVSYAIFYEYARRNVNNG